MKIPFHFAALFTCCLTAAALAEDKPTVKEELKALIIEDAKKQAAKPAPKPATANPPKPEAPAPAAVPGNTAAAAPAPAPATKPPAELSGTLPTVEVNRSKITETDQALNGDALNLKILGGESAKVRSGIAKERVELMQFERDLMEAIAKAKTDKEKTELKKQLDDIKAMRRDLELQR